MYTALADIFSHIGEIDEESDLKFKLRDVMIAAAIRHYQKHRRGKRDTINIVTCKNKVNLNFATEIPLLQNLPDR